MYSIWNHSLSKNLFLSMKVGIKISFLPYMRLCNCRHTSTWYRKSWSVETQSHFGPSYVALEDLFSIVNFHFHIGKVETIMFALCIVAKILKFWTQSPGRVPEHSTRCTVCVITVLVIITIPLVKGEANEDFVNLQIFHSTSAPRFVF